MNKTICSILIAGTVSALAGCEWGDTSLSSTDQQRGAATVAERPAPTADELAAATPVAYRVEGMHCGGCAAGLEEKLAGLSGVLVCKVSYEDSRAEIAVTDPSVTPAIEAAIDELGYTYAVASEADEASDAESPESSDADATS